MLALYASASRWRVLPQPQGSYLLLKVGTFLLKDGTPLLLK